jgi:Tol biopolymer transport system component
MWYMPLVPEPGEAILFAASGGTFSNYRVSPDGRHIAYFHSPTGFTGVEVYVDQFPQSAGGVPVSDGGLMGVNNALAWSPDGQRLFYTRATTGSMMEVEITETDTGALQTTVPREIFNGLASGLNLLAGFALSPDGERFLMVRSTVPAGGDAGGFVLVDGGDPR